MMRQGHHDCRETVAADTTYDRRPTKRQLPYRPPRLICYGEVAKLTRALNGSGTDGGPAGMSLMMCL